MNNEELKIKSYPMKKYPFLSSILLFLFVMLSLSVVGQNTQDLALADEYYEQGEYEKAIQYYEKIAKKNPSASYIYNNYLDALIRLEKLKEADKYIQRCLKDRPLDPKMNIDYAKLLLQKREEKNANKHFDEYINSIKANSHLARVAARVLAHEGFYEQAEKLYLQAQKNTKENYEMDLGLLYLAMGKPEKMVEQFLTLLKKQPNDAPYVQHLLQSRLSEDEEWDMVEPMLYEAVQKNPNDEVFSEMLVWYFLQRKNFLMAFRQAKALDRRNKLEGVKIMEIGMLAYNNEEWKSAMAIFEHLTENYKGKLIYSQARHFLMESKEEYIKHQFPIDKEQIRSLVSDYQQTLEEIGWRPSTAKSARNMALLQAFYLDQKDIAVENLNKITEVRGVPHQLLNQVKLDLGDIYVLKNEPWEATLLYSQVEKAEKETPLGYTAKLKNAKLSYFNGDFKLAKAHLDILKLATSREIANDAMDLSILIQDNTGLDSTETAMKQYAAIDLLIFQQQYSDALAAYKKMLSHFDGHSLTDEIYWKQATILQKMGRFEEAAEKLKMVLKINSTDIFGDDANFLLGKIYEENLNEPQKAEEYYKKQLIDYAGSVYVVEARKRIRKLRGEIVN
ncbi:tetratricopeptide repeat protein [Bernardetia sp.]|uniref:tetratricopeptide repeat protein n=1 Tax=Bernardetia sp. TaxID=1937974 RepID=UPI0025BA7A70|nr:tetratricopeptide repeat protein [Bernardetia sp.]